ncbi:DUF5667 domain-containing protein [Amycolatopsis sp. H20-H5]|uniref:DUF5667 domain-containing protein n=1 Tax=Amycolatopsis sp. H20-H5 TaxID=3046309 RepID=UPI002DB6AD57|nr:DUF5667 domain-containing protein [Amycolatopsis sp. H20-H5]MEC3975344.1 DUF5667 domain-containing protein [Amycolatopsis sp. H20-H5]
MAVPGWFSRERSESERFAIAVDGGEHDDEFADELSLLTGLRELGSSGSPDVETRQRIRAEIAAQLGPDGEVVPPRRHWRPTKANLVAAALALVLALGGLSLLLSKDALPGDALYQVKLAGEATTLGLTFGDRAKAEKHLEFATNRVLELGELARSGADSQAYVTGLGVFESEVHAGVAQLTALASGNGGQVQLSDLRRWAVGQEERLTEQQATIPAAARDRFASAQALLGRVKERATDLSSRLGCYQITTGTPDELGVVPAQGACEQPSPSLTDVTPPGAPDVTPPPPSSGAPSAAPVTSTTSSPDLGLPTGGLPAPTGGTLPPPVLGPPIRITPAPRPTTVATQPPPLISLPPVLPGLPPIIIG